MSFIGNGINSTDGHSQTRAVYDEPKLRVGGVATTKILLDKLAQSSFSSESKRKAEETIGEAKQGIQNLFSLGGVITSSGRILGTYIQTVGMSPKLKAEIDDKVYFYSFYSKEYGQNLSPERFKLKLHEKIHFLKGDANRYLVRYRSRTFPEIKDVHTDHYETAIVKFICGIYENKGIKPIIAGRTIARAIPYEMSKENSGEDIPELNLGGTRNHFLFKPSTRC